MKHRVAFWTIRAEEVAGASELFRLTGSKAEDIDAFLASSQKGATIEAHQDGSAGARRTIPREAVFEIYQEAHEPPLQSLFDGLTESQR